jgi:succinate-semialdehyde dehydrogenase / glutarate-semialdehyde dehydrogenase
MMQSKNPATGKVLARFDELTPEQLDDKLERARSAFARQRLTSFAERAAAMRRAADLLERNQLRLGTLAAQEMGKTLTSAVAEIAKCAWVCRYYAEHAERHLADERAPIDGATAYTRCLPLGPVLAVMPWNFPFWQVFRFAAPALMAGNVGLLKHASNVPQCALAIERVLRDAGFDEGVFQTLLLGSARVAAVIEDPRVAAVTLTGSEGAGAQVGATAGKALKRSVLELGGSDPFIVMPSADLEDAAATAVKARCINNGQSCIASKRFIVHQEVYGEFEARFVAGLQRLVVGDPMRTDTDVGPLATEQVLADVTRQVADSIAAGARLLCGGERIEGEGNFYAPTALTDIPPSAPAYREEVFGPVASLFRVADAGAAIALANDTPFGLGSSVWTRDEGEQQRFINELEAGQTFVNAMVASDPRIPFGGVKRSGYGRELAAVGIREFVNLKTVWIAGAK